MCVLEVVSSRSVPDLVRILWDLAIEPIDLVTHWCTVGGDLPRDAGPVKGGTTVIAFARDPTGYMWEIIERKGKAIPEPIAQACPAPFRLPTSSLLLKCLNRGVSVRSWKAKNAAM